MQRKAIVISAVLAIAGAIVGIVLLRSTSTKTEQTELTDDEILARRRAARREGKVDTRAATLDGRVVDAKTGAGIAGSIVSITERSLDGGARGQPGATPEPLTAVSGPDGRFRTTELPPGRYSIAATAAGYVPALVDPVDLAPGDQRAGVVLELSKGGHALSGTVTDIGGGPVAGALVRAQRGFEGSIMAMFRSPFSTVTDEAGRYSLQLLDGPYELHVQHVDYVQKERSIEIHGGPQVEDFQLVPGGIIEGKVVTAATGDPVAGAMVTEAPEEMRFSGVGIGMGAAVTDDEGRFTLRGLGSGAIRLQAVGRGFTTKEPTLVELGIGEHIDDVIVYVDAAYTVSGFVVDKNDRSKAVSGVLVGAYNLSPGALLVATDPSAEDGYFEILGVPAGTYTVGAVGEQRVPTVLGPSITVTDRDIDDVVVELDPGVTVAGRVDPPAAGAEVSVSFEMESFGLNFAPMIAAALARATTDETGAFELRGLAKGQFSIVARTDEGREGRTAVTVGADDMTGVVVKLEDRARVSGVVVNEAGTAVAGVRVDIEPKKPREEMFDLSAAMRGRGGGALTRSDGTFEALGLRPGTHNVTVQLNGQPLAWAGAEHADKPNDPIVIEIDGTKPITGLRLVVESRTEQIRGVVIGPDGAPAADAWVTARYWTEKPESKKDKAKPDSDGADEDEKGSVTVTVSLGGSDSGASTESTSDAAKAREMMRRYAPAEQPVLTDASGRFVISGLRRGTYDLEAEGSRGGARGHLRDVRVGSDVTLRLEALSTIRGVVRRAGNPVENYSVSLEGPTNRRRAVANREGRYEFQRVEPGSYDVNVTAADGRGSAKVDIASNRTTEQNLDLVAYSSVTGVVVDAQTGEPMSGYHVTAYSKGGDMAEMFNLFTGDGPKTDAKGRFRVGRLGAGDGVVVIMDGDRNAMAPVASKKFDLKPGQDLDLGTIHGNSAGVVPRAERGELAMVATVATWKARPGSTPKDRREPPDGMSADAEHLWVADVEKDGPAAAAGVQIGDRIVAVDGMDVATVGPELVREALAPIRTRAGDSRTLGIDRDGNRSTVTVEARPVATD